MSEQPPYPQGPPGWGNQPYQPYPGGGYDQPPRRSSSFSALSVVGGIVLGVVLTIGGPVLGVLAYAGITGGYHHPDEPPESVEGLASVLSLVLGSICVWIPVILVCFRRTRWLAIWALVGIPVAFIVAAGACVVLFAGLASA